MQIVGNASSYQAYYTVINVEEAAVRKLLKNCFTYTFHGDSV